MSLKYHLATYGCQMNEYDSNLVASMLEEQGYGETSEVADADVVIVNTCSIRGKAEESISQRIMALRPIKLARPDMRIAVIGCMAENHGTDLLKTMRHIDVVAGPDQYRKLVGLLDHPRHRRAPKPVLTGFDLQENYGEAKARLTNPYSAQITIQRGCNKRCSYCIVPFTRGQEKYRSPAHILEEVRHAVSKGIKEVILLGQTVNSYRYDTSSFADLLSIVAEEPGVERIRFMSPHPRHYSKQLLDLLLTHPKMCRHVHLPLQSGSNEQLKKMRRQYDVEDFLAITEQLRSADPLYGISTDIIVGFVDETENDFQATLDVVRQVQFDTAFMFSYSSREGTEAAQWIETVDEVTKSRRLQELVDLQNSITLERNRLMIGQSERILVERPSSKNPQEWVGRTSNFKKIIFPNSSSIQAGDFADISIDDMRGWTLRGTLRNP